MKKEKVTFEKPTFEKVEESSSEVIVSDQSITTIERKNISTSLDGTVSSDGKGGYFVRGADQESTAAKLLVINKKLFYWYFFRKLANNVYYRCFRSRNRKIY